MTRQDRLAETLIRRNAADPAPPQAEALVIALAYDCVFRELWAQISRDLGHAFHAILGRHFADAGRLAGGFMESGLIGSVKRFRNIGPASEAFS